MVKDSPTFKDVGFEVSDFIRNCDLAGFNSNKFDIPLLAEEFLRADIEVDMHKVSSVDVQNIFHKKEQRTLTAALKFYCNTELINAHNAESDVRATLDVLKAQIDRYQDLPNDIPGLSKYSTRNKAADFAGFITFNKENEEQFSFGKYRGQTVSSVLSKDPGYYSWVQNDWERDGELVRKSYREYKIVKGLYYSRLCGHSWYRPIGEGFPHPRSNNPHLGSYMDIGLFYPGNGLWIPHRRNLLRHL